MRRLAVTAELGYDFSDRLSSFVEYYGVFGPAVHGCDLGLSYALTNDLFIDLSCGRTYYQSGGVTYAALGASFRPKADPHIWPLPPKSRGDDRARSPSIEGKGADPIDQSPHTTRR